MPYAHPEALVTTEWLAAHLNDPAVSIVDASFKLPGIAPTAAEDYAKGHIPGARNVPWSKAANEDGTFKSLEELQRLYLEEQGLDTGAETIAYCRIGERSSHTWFVLRELLGFKDVKNYDGSWTEYGSLVGVPIAKEHVEEGAVA